MELTKEEDDAFAFMGVECSTKGEWIHYVTERTDPQDTQHSQDGAKL